MAEPKHEYTEAELFDFAAFALSFAGDGYYRQFLAYMEAQGYSEAEVEQFTEEIGARCGRV